MQQVKSILALIGLVALLMMWKAAFPGSWSSFWTTVGSFF